MENDIDTFFSRVDDDPTLYTKADIEALVNYYRKARTDKTAGIKPKKDAGPKGTINLQSLNLVPKTETPKLRRI